MKKIIITILVLAGLGVTTFLFRGDFAALQKTAQNDPSIAALQQDLKTVTDKIYAPAPLRFTGGSSQSTLTVSGVIAETNRNRQTENLAALTESAALEKAAQLKVDDMFKNQYFEHVSPSGVGPAELAKKVGYDYILVGENLALGNFKDDAELLNGWMNSPGHRANIMRVGYTQIGVAVKKGIFNGQETWLAVQEFGTPASACPTTSKALAASIDSNRAELARQEPIITQKKQELDAYEPKQGAGYEAKVREYNDLIAKYNSLVQTIKVQVEEYNKEVNAYNTCSTKYSK